MDNKKLVISLFIAVTIAIIAANAQSVFAADNSTDNSAGYKYIGASLAVGLAGIGAGIGMGTASSAGIGALVENPEIFGKVFLFIVLIEAIAIYGLLIAIILTF